MTGRWRWLDGHGWLWSEDPDAVQAQRVIQPVNDPPPLDGEFREHQTKAGPLWVPAGARLHDVPFGFRS